MLNYKNHGLPGSPNEEDSFAFVEGNLHSTWTSSGDSSAFFVPLGTTSVEASDNNHRDNPRDNQAPDKGTFDDLGDNSDDDEEDDPPGAHSDPSTLDSGVASTSGLQRGSNDFSNFSTTARKGSSSNASLMKISRLQRDQSPIDRDERWHVKPDDDEDGDDDECIFRPTGGQADC